MESLDTRIVEAVEKRGQPQHQQHETGEEASPFVHLS
jgi:hypothetical protein